MTCGATSTAPSVSRGRARWARGAELHPAFRACAPIAPPTCPNERRRTALTNGASAPTATTTPRKWLNHGHQAHRRWAIAKPSNHREVVPLPVTQTGGVKGQLRTDARGRKWRFCRDFVSGAAQESNLPTVGLQRPASFEDRRGAEPGSVRGPYGITGPKTGADQAPTAQPCEIASVLKAGVG
jgi:hypothetical protein